ncbi:MAG: oligoendopeptidase F [Oscillospiraceae bacterium]|nr:oligoendopeptidase F [Oscillospiraceae bacterium]
MAINKIIPDRKDQNPAACWSIEDLFPSDAAWEEAFQACRDLPEKAAAWQGRLGESAQSLLDYLTFSENLNLQIEPLYVYALLRLDEDTAHPEHQSMHGRCVSLLVRLDSASAFEGPELTAIPEETLNGFYTQLPALEKYRRFLTKARLEREHILSQSEETLLAGVGEISRGPSDIFHSFTDADMKFPPALDSEGNEHTLTNGTYISLMESTDRALRKDAFIKFYGVYGSFRNTLAAALNAEIRKSLFFAKARKYPGVLAASLHPVEVPESVYHSLIEAVHKNLNKMYRYMELRKKLLGVDRLHMYDIYAPIVPGETSEVISFERARDEILASVQALGEDYSRVAAESFRQRWMDVYENTGKRSGGYCCGTRVHPYILLNYTDDLKSEFTLAHELGHAMHSYLSNKYQPPVYSSYVLFVAEVASTCNEALLMHHLLQNTTDKRKRAVLINYFLEQFRTTLYRQTMFAEFELETHRLAEAGETLNAQKFCEIYYKLNQLYYGELVGSGPADLEIAVEWSRIPHFYQRFYVYQYATGFSAAMALSKRILKDGEEAVRDYLAFLKGGCSADPLSLLRTAGVDLSTPKPVEDALEQFGGLIEELEELLL